MTLLDLVILGLGTWLIWETIISHLPSRALAFIPLVAPFVVVGLAWGLANYASIFVQQIIAVAAFVAIIHMLLDRPKPVQVGRERWRPR